MRIASRFQRRGRARNRQGHALVASVWVGLISLGCFFELPELQDPDSGLGGAGTFGVGGSGGGAPVGGDSGSGVGGSEVFPGCNDQPGFKLCGDTCVPIGPENGCGDPDSCTPCAPVANAAAPTCGGDSQRCQIASCNAGHADCDGDLSAYSGVSGSSNGCEYSFGTIADSSQPLTVSRAQIRVDDNTRDDWGGIPAYRLEKTCVDCRDGQTVFEPSAQNEPPPSSDLSAYFRVAWDADSFYVLAEAFDDHVFKEGSSIDNGGCRTSTDGNYVPGPVCEDAFALYFDGGLEPGGNIGNNDVHRIFLGTSGRSFLPSQGQPPEGTIGLRVVQPNGPGCYRMEAQFPWTLLVSNQGQPVAGKFPPAEGQTYGFDIAVSDWDRSVSDESSFERQSQLFWNQRAPQSQLHPSIVGVGTIILSNHADGQTPQ